MAYRAPVCWSIYTTDICEGESTNIDPDLDPEISLKEGLSKPEKQLLANYLCVLTLLTTGAIQGTAFQQFDNFRKHSKFPT